MTSKKKQKRLSGDSSYVGQATSFWVTGWKKTGFKKEQILGSTMEAGHRQVAAQTLNI